MPPTENCPLGAANKAKIEGNRQAFEDFRDEIRVTATEIWAAVGAIRKDIEKMTNHFSKKPSWSVAMVLILLTSLLTGLVTAVITAKFL